MGEYDLGRGLANGCFSNVVGAVEMDGIKGGVNDYVLVIQFGYKGVG